MRIKQNRGAIIAAALILSGLLAGFYMAWQRMQIEAEGHKAEIVMDWSQITAQAQKDDVSYEQVLSQFAPYISGILIKEPTVYTLSDEGRAVILGGDELKLQLLQGGNIAPENLQTNYRYVLFYNEEDAIRTLAAVNTRMNAAYAELFYYDGYYLLGTSLTRTELSGMGIGFDTETLDLLQKYNLGVAVQVRDFPNLTAESIYASVKVLADYRVIGVGFNYSAVPGAELDTEAWKECKNAWAEALNKIGAPLISIELYAQKGMESLSQAMAPAVLRMHSVSEAEMKVQATVEGAPQRYQLATSERNIKIAFVRMLPSGTAEESADFVRLVREAIEAKNTEIGPTVIPAELHVPTALMLLLIAAVCAGGWLLGIKFRFGRWALILAALAFAGGAGLLLLGRAALVQKLFALCAVLIFPTLAIMLFQPQKGLPLGKAILRIIYTCLFSLIGAVLMVGLLGDNLYMLKIDGFVGVKIAHLIPVLLVLGFFFFLHDKERTPWRKLQSAWNYKVSVGFAAVACLLLLVMYIYLSRTGNDNAQVSGLEKWLRVFLDQTLYVRPRTKEFLLGYPCLLFMYYYGYRDLYLPVMALAVIGQVSLVNTYAHIHTPLVYGLLRSFNGLWLGLLTAVVFILVVNTGVKIFRKYKGKLQQNV